MNDANPADDARHGTAPDTPTAQRPQDAPEPDAPETADSAATGGGRRAAATWLCVVVLIVLHMALILRFFAPAIATPDANGYWAQGSLLATQGRTWFAPETDPQYIGLHWLVSDGRYYSRYPPGLALLVGGVYKLFGYRASLLVNPVLAALSLLGMFVLGRRLLSPLWGLLGLLLLAMNPTFCRHALVCDSHMAVLCLLVWGVYFLVRWSDEGRRWQTFVAGVVLGSIPTVRYPEVLFALGIGTFLLLHLRRHPMIWQHYAAACLGAAIPVLPLLVHNHLAFGAFWRTAYSLTNEQTGFGWNYFRLHAVNYLRQLHADGVGLLFPFGVVGMAMLCCSRKHRATGWLLVLLAVPMVLVYMAYYWAPANASSATLRFLLPVFVPFLLAGLWFLAWVSERLPGRTRYVGVAVVVVLQAIWWGFSSTSELKTSAYSRQALAAVTNALEQHTERGDIVIAHQQILQHLDFVRKWRLADASVLRGRSAMRGRMNMNRDPDAPTPMQTEKREIQAEKYSGLRPFGRERQVAVDIRKWAGEQKVYFVGPLQDIKRMVGYYFNADTLKTVARIELPDAPELPVREGMGGAGMMRTQRDGGRGADALGRLADAADGLGGLAGAALDAGRQMGGFQGRQQQQRLRLRGAGQLGRWSFLFAAGELVLAEWTWQPPGVD